MEFFNSGIFWFIEGILFCLVLAGIHAWVSEKEIRMHWMKWVMVILWLFLAGFSISFVGTSLGEFETVAAWKGGVILGLISVISGVGIFRYVFSSGKSGS